MSLRLGIQAIRSVQHELSRLDPAAGRPELPSPPASPAAMDAAAGRLSGNLPPSYREFLAIHDGWRHFFQGVSLLSAEELGRRSMPAFARASFVLLGEEPQLIPFALDEVGDSLFAWDLERRGAGDECSAVAYLNGVLVRVESFPELLELVLDMLAADAEERRKQIRRAAKLAASAQSRGPLASRQTPQCRSAPVRASVIPV